MIDHESTTVAGAARFDRYFGDHDGPTRRDLEADDRPAPKRAVCGGEHGCNQLIIREHGDQWTPWGDGPSGMMHVACARKDPEYRAWIGMFAPAPVEVFADAA